MKAGSTESFIFRRPERGRKGNYSSRVVVTAEKLLSEKSGLRRVHQVDVSIGGRNTFKKMCLKQFNSVLEAENSEKMYVLLKSLGAPVPTTYRIDHNKHVAVMTLLSTKDVAFITANNVNDSLPKHTIRTFSNFNECVRSMLALATELGNKKLMIDLDAYGFLIPKHQEDPSLDFKIVDLENLLVPSTEGPQIDTRAAIAYNIGVVEDTLNKLIRNYVRPERQLDLESELKLAASNALSQIPEPYSKMPSRFTS